MSLSKIPSKVPTKYLFLSGNQSKRIVVFGKEPVDRHSETMRGNYLGTETQ